tara:strand:- start:726 stop:968 length:243 start_codon:yes stop_codon:yes gene_type:complete
MNDEQLFKEQHIKDILSRVKELERTHYMALKQRMDPSRPANCFYGDFSELDGRIRLTDIPDYVSFLIEQYELDYKPEFGY